MLVSTMPLSTISTSRTNLILRMTNSVTNAVSGGQAAIVNAGTYPPPTTTNDYMSFNGNQCIRFANASNFWHVTAPYSVEMDVYCSNNNDGRWIATVGEGYGEGWPEWSIAQTSASSLILSSSANNTGNQFSQTLLTNYTTNQWYRIGFMFYTIGAAYKCKGFVNGVQTFDIACSVPYTNTTNGLMFGGDWAWNDNSNAIARKWTGRIRNVTIARSSLWS